jgi:uncharacterized membrane protein HdeD (DUF308 family)
VTPGRACLIRGLASIVLGAAVLALPEVTLEVLVRLIGVYALLAGVVAIAGGATARAWLVVGALDLVVGIGVFAWPGAAALALLWPLAVTIWAVLGGVAMILAAGRFRPQSSGRWLLRASGVVAVGFGVVLTVVAVPGTQPLVWLVGGYALLAGALWLGVAVSVVQTFTPRGQPAD